MWACGIVALYKERYFPSADQCRTDVPPKTNTGPLKLVDLTGPFFLLGLGLSLSIMIFIIECLVMYLKKTPCFFILYSLWYSAHH